MFEVLTHGGDTIPSFGAVGLTSGEWVMCRAATPANWEEDGA